MIAHKFFKSCFILFSFMLLQPTFAMDASKKTNIKPSSQADKKSKTEAPKIAVILAAYNSELNNWMFLLGQPKNSDRYTAFLGNAMPSETTEQILARIVSAHTYGQYAQDTIENCAKYRIKKTISAGQMGYIIPVVEIDVADLNKQAAALNNDPIKNYTWVLWPFIKRLAEKNNDKRYDLQMARYIYDNYDSIIEPYLNHAQEKIASAELERQKKENPEKFIEMMTLEMHKAIADPNKQGAALLKEVERYICNGADLNKSVSIEHNYVLLNKNALFQSIYKAKANLIPFLISQGVKMEESFLIVATEGATPDPYAHQQAVNRALETLEQTLLCCPSDILSNFLYTSSSIKFNKNTVPRIIKEIEGRAEKGNKIPSPKSLSKDFWDQLEKNLEALDLLLNYFIKYEKEFIKSSPEILHGVIRCAMKFAQDAVAPKGFPETFANQIAISKSNFDTCLSIIVRLIDLDANPGIENEQHITAFDLVPYQGPIKEYAARIWQVLNKNGYVDEVLKTIDNGTGNKLFGPIADIIGELAVSKHDEMLEFIDTAAAKKITEETIISKLRARFNKGYSRNSCNNNQKSLLMYACQRGMIKVIKFLLEQPEVDQEADQPKISQVMVDIDARDKSGMNALMYAAEAGHAHVIDMLVEHAMCTFDSKIAATKIRLMINAQTKRFEHVKLSSRHRKSGTERYRLAADGSVDLESIPERTTALMIAVNRGDIQVVGTLLKYKADITLQDKHNKTARMYATELQRHEILRMFDTYRS